MQRNFVYGFFFSLTAISLLIAGIGCDNKCQAKKNTARLEKRVAKLEALMKTGKDLLDNMNYRLKELESRMDPADDDVVKGDPIESLR